jgi:serine/threonine-protein kinase HipA
MNVKALVISIRLQQRIGVLFRYAMPGAEVVTRFVADDDFAHQPEPVLVSAAYVANTPQDQAAF